MDLEQPKGASGTESDGLSLGDKCTQERVGVRRDVWYKMNSKWFVNVPGSFLQ